MSMGRSFDVTTAEMMEFLDEAYEGCLTADGFEGALIGVVAGACRETVACYDYGKCVGILMERDGMDEEDAEEWMEFNVVGAYVGETTPLFLHDWREE
jgi:hypothetical protein